MAFTGAKLAIQSGMRSVARVLGKTRVGRVAFEQVINTSMQRTRQLHHNGTGLVFCVPNSLNHFRTQTFATKEPETLAWIDTLPEGAVLWDIGANVGLYSCYAAKARRCRVIAFEPSVFNIELLARNVFLNELSSRVTMMPLPLFESAIQSTLNMTSTQWGGALSTFGANHGFDGKALESVFAFRTVGVSMDECVDKLGLPPPAYIKMDVDGIEHIILRGGSGVLRQVKGVTLEINDDFAEQAQESRKLLEAAGLRYVGKAHSQMIEDNATFAHTFNQVWAR